MSALLEIKGLYGGYEKGVNILQGIDLSVSEGETVGILGLNGSGKSTLGKAIMNLIPFRNGKIFFDGIDVSNYSTHRLAQLGIAIMHQGGEVFANLSVWQNLQLAWGRHADNDYYNQLVDIIPLLQLPEKVMRSQMADKLSGGQRHELALAMTMARKPKMVILDEPSAGLSPHAVERMYHLLCGVRVRLNITIIIIEQNIAKVVDFCERCVLLKQGELMNSFMDKNIKDIENTIFII